MITDFDNKIRVVEDTDLIVESSTREEKYVDKDKALRNIIQFEKGCDMINIYTSTTLLNEKGAPCVVMSNNIILNCTGVTSDKNVRALSVSISSHITGKYNDIIKRRELAHEKMCNLTTEGCYIKAWKFNDDIIRSMYNVAIEEDGTCKIPEEIVRLITDPDQLFLTDESFINLVNETFVDNKSEEYKRHLEYFAERNEIDKGLLHHMVEDFENLKNTVLENGQTLKLTPCQQLMVVVRYDGKPQQIVITYQLSQDLFKLVKYYKDSIAETCDTCDIGINKIDRMVNYHFTIHKKE